MKINKLVAVGIIVAITVNLAVVLVGFSYLQNEINQLKFDSDITQSTPEQAEQQATSQTPQETPKYEQTSSPTQATASEGSGANLIFERLSVGWAVNDCDLPILLIGARIRNNGNQTAYGVSLHIKVWSSDGQSMDKIVKLNKELIWAAPPKPVDIAPGESYSLDNRYYRNSQVVSVPPDFKRMDSSHNITLMWD